MLLTVQTTRNEGALRASLLQREQPGPKAMSPAASKGPAALGTWIIKDKGAGPQSAQVLSFTRWQEAALGRRKARPAVGGVGQPLKESHSRRNSLLEEVFCRLHLWLPVQPAVPASLEFRLVLARRQQCLQVPQALPAVTPASLGAPFLPLLSI